MSEDEAVSLPHHGQPPCSYPWCTTPHGATLHQSDEDHRSDGRSITLVLRGRGIDADVRRADAEIGLLRRRNDSQTWLVLEDGRGIHAELAVDSARDLLRALRADAAIALELGLAASAP